ncbi:uncharacterized protein LOC117171388 [Belonocnema kinseyi]|uniref:uncharacterized protein LOC117171388 n=1 Tax=Belonocnema kinseyi TaxID=2817044 RepID=UPI00143DBDF2|nr:uncharacterized protein LOC117171388 [Belonocnema kinseyi]
MAEISEILNEKKLFFGEEKEKRVIQNDTAKRSNLECLESKQNCVAQVAHLFTGLKLSKYELEKSKEADIEMSPVTTSSTESGSKNDQIFSAGKIISVIPHLSTVLVHPAPIHNSWLNVGTNLFIQKSKSGDDTKNILFFGKLEEVFGNVENPLYAVRLSPENYFPKVEDEVFYLWSDPSTSMFHIEFGNNGKSEVIYHR